MDENTKLLCRLLDLTLKLRYENDHMRALLARMGIDPQFPQYQDHAPAKEAA